MKGLFKELPGGDVEAYTRVILKPGDSPQLFD